MILSKKGLKKQLISEKWDDFEKGQRWPFCKGYSKAKWPILGLKLNMRKMCVKRLSKRVKMVLSKKRQEKQLIFEK